MKDVKGVHTPFDDHCPPPEPKPSSAGAVNGEPGLPGRTSSPNGVDEVSRTKLEGNEPMKY